MNEHQKVSCFNRGKTMLYHDQFLHILQDVKTKFFKFRSTNDNLLSCLVCLSDKKWRIRHYDWSDRLSIKLSAKGQSSILRKQSLKHHSKHLAVNKWRAPFHLLFLLTHATKTPPLATCLKPLNSILSVFWLNKFPFYLLSPSRFYDELHYTESWLAWMVASTNDGNMCRKREISNFHCRILNGTNYLASFEHPFRLVTWEIWIYFMLSGSSNNFNIYTFLCYITLYAH